MASLLDHLIQFVSLHPLLAYATVAILFSAALYPFFRQRMLETSRSGARRRG